MEDLREVDSKICESLLESEASSVSPAFSQSRGKVTTKLTGDVSSSPLNLPFTVASLGWPVSLRHDAGRHSIIRC